MVRVITNPNYAAGSAVMKYRSYDYEARAKGDDAGINLGVARQNNVKVNLADLLNSSPPHLVRKSCQDAKKRGACPTTYLLRPRFLGGIIE